MKHLKAYENLINEPQIGDYVICQDSVLARNFSNNKSTIIFLSNNIGRIITDDSIDYDVSKRYSYVIKYENIPKDIEDYFNLRKKESEKNFEMSGLRAFSLEEIIYHSKNKEDLEIYIDTEKYNL